MTRNESAVEYHEKSTIRYPDSSKQPVGQTGPPTIRLTKPPQTTANHPPIMRPPPGLIGLESTFVIQSGIRSFTYNFCS